MLFKFAIPAVFATVLLHTFVGTVAAVPQGPIIIPCMGSLPTYSQATAQVITPVLAATFAATTPVVGSVKMANFSALCRLRS
ncbi:hypothetical protein F5878DRAFT_630459 [Lentinula raphanica]|uniref:Secreted protein n=1 Tax=Lentinula raphanica TaxID=153919 RepID=A0AA38P198_9AGAR|nr:hypothetical protein F5878DRAFT_630459 [Lentinula raphanica]